MGINFMVESCTVGKLGKILLLLPLARSERRVAVFVEPENRRKKSYCNMVCNLKQGSYGQIHFTADSYTVLAILIGTLKFHTQISSVFCFGNLTLSAKVTCYTTKRRP